MQDANDEKYTYISAGFDRFFKRSIFGSYGFSLGESENTGGQTASSNQLNYDSSSITGSLGDLLTVGNILIDGVNGNIDLKDSEDRVTIRMSSES